MGRENERGEKSCVEKIEPGIHKSRTGNDQPDANQAKSHLTLVSDACIFKTAEPVNVVLNGSGFF